MGQEASVPRHDDNAANLGGSTTGNNSHLAPPQEGGSSTHNVINVGTSPRNNGTGSTNSSTPTATTTSRVGMSERAPGIIPYHQPQHAQMITTATTQSSQPSTVSSPTTASQSIMSRAGITSMMQRIGGVASSSNNTRGGLSNGISKATAATHNGGAELSPESTARQQAMSMQKKQQQQQQQQNTTYNVNMMYNTGQPQNNRSSSPTNNISQGISNIQLSPKRSTTTTKQQHTSPPPSPRAITLKQMSNNDEEDWQKAWEEDSEEESDDDDEHDDGVVENDRGRDHVEESTPSLASSVGATAGSERDNNRILPNVPNLVVGKQQQQQATKPSITTTAASIIQQGGIPPIPPYTPANNQSQQLETLKTPIIQYKPIQPKSHFTSPIIPSIQAGYTQDEIDEENRLVQTANEILGSDSEYVRGQTHATGGGVVIEGDDDDDQEVIERPCCEMFEPALRVLGRGSFGRVSLLYVLQVWHVSIFKSHLLTQNTPHTTHTRWY